MRFEPLVNLSGGISPVSLFGSATSGVYPFGIDVMARYWFVNRAPLTCRSCWAPIGNSRFLLTNGDTDEVFEDNRKTPGFVVQECQEVRHQYTDDDLPIDAGLLSSPLDRSRMIALQNCIDDFETSCYYGDGKVRNRRPTMKGPSELVGISLSLSLICLAAVAGWSAWILFFAR